MGNAKAWKCLNCGSYDLDKVILRGRIGKWLVQGRCKVCDSVTRFSKYGSILYYRAPKKPVDTTKIPF